MGNIKLLTVNQVDKAERIAINLNPEPIGTLTNSLNVDQ